MGDVEHAPLVQHVLDVKATLFLIRELFATPRLQILAQSAFFTPSVGVVLGDDKRLVLVGFKGGSVLIFAMDFPHKLELALVVCLALVVGFLSSHIDDAETTCKVHTCGDWFENGACIFENHLSTPNILLNWS